MIIPDIYKDKVIAIMGFGKTGESALHFLLHSRVRRIIIIDDDKKKISAIYSNPKLSTALNKNTLIVFNTEDICNKIADIGIDFMIISPGIVTQGLKIHKIIKQAKVLGIKIISDIDLFYKTLKQNNKNTTLIGITGSNGKSTTTALITFILKVTLTKKCSDTMIYAAGNIGNPVLDVLPYDTYNGTNSLIYVLEISSFQLDITSNILLDVAVCTNITSDHLDRYEDITDYTLSKIKIFDLIQHDGIRIIPKDYNNSYHIISKISTDIDDKNFIPFSVKSRLQRGMSIIDSILEIKDICGIDYFRLDISNLLPISLLGWHNAENICCAIAVCLSLNLKLTVEEILDAISKFDGLPHRAQLVAEQNGIKFINDSKATNVASSVCALEVFQNIYWIVGGKSKGEDLTALTGTFHNIKKAYLIGAVVEDLAVLCEQNQLPYEKCYTVENALVTIKNDINSIKYVATVLLSPAHSSLDQWQNFEERGRYFCSRVKEIWKC